MTATSISPEPESAAADLGDGGPWWVRGLRLLAWVVCLTPYLLSAYSAVDQLGEPLEQGTTTWDAHATGWLLTAIAVAGAIILASNTPTWSQSPVSVRAITAAGAGYALALALGTGVLEPALRAAGLVEPYPGSVDPPPTWINVGDSIAAGVGEEVVVVAAGVAVLAATSARRWWTVPAIVILVAVRVSYHLYYGWGVLWLVPWAITAAILAWYVRSWWVIAVFAIVHTAYDLTVWLADAEATFAVVGGVISFALLVWLYWTRASDHPFPRGAM
jgi:hypothetical protein